MSAWYLTPEVLDLLAVIRVHGLRVTWVNTCDGQRDSFADPLYDSLEAWCERLDQFARVWPIDIAAAVSGVRLVGRHFLSDEPALIAIRNEVDAALREREMIKELAA